MSCHVARRKWDGEPDYSASTLALQCPSVSSRVMVTNAPTLAVAFPNHQPLSRKIGSAPFENSDMSSLRSPMCQYRSLVPHFEFSHGSTDQNCKSVISATFTINAPKTNRHNKYQMKERTEVVRSSDRTSLSHW